MIFLVLSLVIVMLILLLLGSWRQYEKNARRQRARISALEDETETLKSSIPVQRKAAVRKSREVNTGLITQDIAPLLPDWPYSLKDTRQVGAPLDYIVFNGLENDDVQSIVFVEVKSGNARLSARQRQIMKAIDEGRVTFQVYTPVPPASTTI